MGRLAGSLSALAACVLLAGCSGSADPSASDTKASAATAALGKVPASSAARQAVGSVPEIVNPAEELVAFAPDGILRWSAVAGADAYEVWAYDDAGLTQLAEFSKALVSRQYQFTQLAGGRTYHVKLYFRVGGVWSEVPAFTIKTTSNVTKARLSNPQEELEAFGPSGTLRWSPVAGADVYEVWVYRDSSLVAFAEASGPLTRVTQYQITSLTPGTTYYVQVYARVNGSYTVGGPLKLTVTSQLDRARILNPQEELDAFATDGILRWSPVTGATAYELWVFTNPNSSEIYENSGSLAGREYKVRTLQPGATYYVQAFAFVNGQWQVGAPMKLTTIATPTKPRLTNPQAELETFTTSGTLRWTAVPNATAYELWIYGNAGLGTVIERGANADRSYTVSKLCSGAVYYVQVYALVNGEWTSGWATRLDLTQGASPAGCVPPAPTVRLTADPVDVTIGRTATLTWTTQFATSCAASGSWAGPKALSGTETVGPLTQNALYVLNCTGPSGAYRAERFVLVAGFTESGAVGRHYMTYPANAGYLSRSGSVLELEYTYFGGEGRLLETTSDGVSQRGRNSPINWEIVDGSLLAWFPTPVETPSVTPWSTLDLSDDERAQLEQYGPPTGQVQLIYRTLSHRYTRRLDAPPYQNVDLETTGEVDVAPIALTNGSTLDLSRYPKSQVGSSLVILRAEDEVPPVRFSSTCPGAGGAVCVPGGWGGIFPYTPQPGGSGLGSTESIYGDIVQFNTAGTADGTFVAHPATWTVDAEGVLVITHANGWSQRVRILDVNAPVYGVVSEYTKGSERYAGYENFVRSEPGFRFTEGYVASQAGRFWNSDINGWNPTTLAPDGSLGLSWYFGWEFAVPGPSAFNFSLAETFDCDSDGQADDIRAGRNANTWSLDAGGRLVIDRRPSRPGTSLRYWTPIATATVNGSRVFHVLEAQYASGALQFPPRLNSVREIPKVWNCTNPP